MAKTHDTLHGFPIKLDIIFMTQEEKKSLEISYSIMWLS